MKLSRNDLCWCNSGLKYKKCHLHFDEKLAELKRAGYTVPTRSLIKTKEQIDGIRKSAIVNNGLLDLIGKNIKVGMTTEEIDKMAYDFITANGGVPADLNYEGFPKSICVSVNDEVCHGIPNEKVILKSGDIVNVDATTIVDGYFSDASRMYMIGKVSKEAERLVRVTKECLNEGLKAVKPWGFLGDIGAAIQEHAEKNGYSVVREFCGHGVGLEMHEEPTVLHFGTRGTGMVLVPGMVLTIEPMINAGEKDIYIDRSNGWTVRTVDGSLSAQWEHTLLITDSGIEIISK